MVDIALLAHNRDFQKAVYSAMDYDLKTVSAPAKTKRRRYTTSPYVVSPLSARVSRLAKKMKIQNPPHVYVTGLTSGSGSWNTTGAVFDCCQAITQGDAYNQRFGNKIVPKRVNIKGSVHPGSTANAPVTIRLSLVRANSGFVGGNFVSSSISPIADNNILQVYYDRIFTIAPTNAGQTYPVNINLSIPIKLNHIKFSGSGAAAVTAESIFLHWCSNVASGTTAPIWSAGVCEFFFIP